MNCQKAESLLSEYIDSTLSARETWELDKHLAGCNACTRLANEMRRTVSMLAEAPRFEVSDSFVANLQARIAGVEQEPPRRAWADSLRELFRPRVRPVWGAAMGTCALAALFLFQNAPHKNPEQQKPSTTATLVQTARTQSIALAASDPFGDTAAASMAANAAMTVSATTNAQPTPSDEPVD